MCQSEDGNEKGEKWEIENTPRQAWRWICCSPGNWSSGKWPCLGPDPRVPGLMVWPRPNRSLFFVPFFPFFLYLFSLVIFLKTLITEYYLLVLLIFNRHFHFLFLFLFFLLGLGSFSAYYFSRSVGSGPGSSRPSGTLAWDTNWTILQSFRYAG